MRNLLLSITLLTCTFYLGIGQTTFYTTGLSGEWSDPVAWTLTADGTEPAGPPAKEDHVVISHYLTHFTVPGYTHTGNITVRPRGTYEMITGIEEPGQFIFSGNTFDVEGNIITINDLVIRNHQNDYVSQLHLQESSLVHINGSLILDGNTEAIMDNKSCGAGQTTRDLWFKTPTARVCGEGTFIVSNRIRAWDEEGNEIEPSAAGMNEIRSRICEGFSFYGSAEDCENNVSMMDGIGGMEGLEGGFKVSDLKLYPNPSTDNAVNLKVKGFEPNTEVLLTVRNMLGQPLNQISIQTDATGKVEYRLTHNLDPGAYVLMLNSDCKMSSENLQVL